MLAMNAPLRFAPLLRTPARRCAARCVASGGGGGGEGASGGDGDGESSLPSSRLFAKLAAPPGDWPYGLHNPRHALQLQGVGIGMLRLRPGEVRSLSSVVTLCCGFVAPLTHATRVQAAAEHMHRHVHQEEVFTVLSGAGEAALGGGRTVKLRRGDLLRVAPSEPRALRALPQGPDNPGGEDLHVLIVGGSTLGGPFPHDPRSRVLLDDRLSLFADLPPWLPAGSAEAAAAAAHNAAKEAAEAEHVMRLRWRLAERAAKLEALQARRAAAKAAQQSTAATVLVSAVALLDDQGRVLLARRPVGKSHANKFEYPGGKVEPGESPQAGLRRELAEELDISVRTEDMFPLAFASEAGERNSLLLMLFGARRWEGTPRGAEGQPLRWVTANELGVRCAGLLVTSICCAALRLTDARRRSRRSCRCRRRMSP